MKHLFAWLFLTLLPPSLLSAQQAEMIFLHINDVYEIGGVSGGQYGHLARVAALKQQLQAQNPHTYLVLSGDFLNPSVFGTMKYEDRPIRGRQMVETMNAAGVDFVCFGNHEFDISESELLERIELSEFEWIATNTFHQTTQGVRPFTRRGQPFDRAKTLLIPADNGNDTLRLGLIGICLPYNNPPHSYFTDMYQSAAQAYDSLRPLTHSIVALTHLNEAEDRVFAERIPGIPLLMGGHDHDHMLHQVGNTTIAKADANARTAYIHRLRYDFATQQTYIDSELVLLDEQIPHEPNTKAVVEHWTNIAFEYMRNLGFDPEEVITQLTEPLEARESEVRNRQTNMGQILADAMREAWGKEVDCGLVGGGAIRIDDQVRGQLTQYDIMRILPFGGQVVKAAITGTTLVALLEAGQANKGSGGYLQHDSRISKKKDQWLINNKPIQANKNYHVALNDYLLTGKEKNMDFMNEANKSQVLEVIYIDTPTDPRSDIRKALIAYLKAK
jgi:5'-nucleotidase